MDNENCAQGEPQTPMQRLEEELHLMKTAGIIEVAIRNPSVSDYMHHWEGRVEKVEAECARLRAEAVTIAAQRDEAVLRADVAEEARRAVEAHKRLAVASANNAADLLAAAMAELARRDAAERNHTTARLQAAQDMREGRG